MAKHLVTQKEFESVRDTYFMCFAYQQNGRYAGSLRNASIIGVMRFQQQEQIKGNVVVICEMRYQHRMPVIGIDPKVDPHTLGFKLAVLPLLMQEPYNPYLSWRDVEDYVMANGYVQPPVNKMAAIAVSKQDRITPGA